MDVEQRVKIAVCLSIAARSMRFAELPKKKERRSLLGASFEVCVCAIAVGRIVAEY